MNFYDRIVVALGEFVHAEPVDWMAVITGFALAVLIAGLVLA